MADFLQNVPSWVVTALFSFVGAWTAFSIKVAVLQSQVSTMKESLTDAHERIDRLFERRASNRG